MARDHEIILRDSAANAKTLQSRYRASLVALGEISLDIRVGQIQKMVILEYLTLDPRDVPKTLRERVDAIRAAGPVMTDEDKAGIGDAHPIVGDVAVMRLTEDQAVQLIASALSLSGQNRASPDPAYLAKLRDLFDPLQAVGGWRNDIKALLAAYDEYVRVTDRQFDVLRRQGEVFSLYAREGGDVTPALLNAAQDAEFQGELLNLIPAGRSRDRAARVLDAFRGLDGQLDNLVP